MIDMIRLHRQIKFKFAELSEECNKRVFILVTGPSGRWTVGIVIVVVVRDSAGRGMVPVLVMMRWRSIVPGTRQGL